MRVIRCRMVLLRPLCTRV